MNAPGLPQLDPQDTGSEIYLILYMDEDAY